MIAQVNSTYIKTRPSKLINRLISYLFFEGRPLTTKGRWINPLLFTLFSLEKRLPAPKKVSKPIFIIGTGRSGTTVLGVVLSMHREVGFLNEPKALWHSAYPNEDIIGSYTSEPAKYWLGEDAATEEVCRAMHRLYGWYSLVSNSSRIVDKYPELIFRIPYVRKIFPDAKFLFLIRNGWDTCHSIKDWSKRKSRTGFGGEVEDWWGKDNRKWKLLTEQVVPAEPSLAGSANEISRLSNHSDMAAVEWIVTMREGLRVCERYPNIVYSVRYEDLTREPVRTLKKITDFCELPSDSVFEEFSNMILHPVESKAPLKLDPIVEPAFTALMHELGYATC